MKQTNVSCQATFCKQFLLRKPYWIHKIDHSKNNICVVLSIFCLCFQYSVLAFISSSNPATSLLATLHVVLFLPVSMAVVKFSHGSFPSIFYYSVSLTLLPPSPLKITKKYLLGTGCHLFLLHAFMILMVNNKRKKKS